VIGTVPILGFKASVLFDLTATHSFVLIIFVRLSRLVVQTWEPSLAVTTPIGKTVICKSVVCGCPVSICGRVLPTNLVVLPIISYDVILEMDWLAKHLAIIDYTRKHFMLRPWGEGEVMYVGSRVRCLPQTISAVRANKLEEDKRLWH
jgi:hypothetical protein